MHQHEFEFALYQCLNYGDEGKIAREAGKGATYYSEMFNPDNPRESIFFRAAQDFTNWICKVNPEGGRKAFETFCGFIEQEIAECNGDASLAAVHKESSEGIQAGLDDKPVDKQIKEAREALSAWASRLRSLERQKAVDNTLKKLTRKAA